MNKQKVYLIIISVIAVACFFISGVMFYRYETFYKPIVMNGKQIFETSMTPDIEFDEYEEGTSGSGNVCLVSKGSPGGDYFIYPDKYVVTHQLDAIQYERNNRKYMLYRQAVIDLYGIQSNKVEKSYHIEDLIEQYAKGYVWQGDLDYWESNGELYIVVWLLSPNDSKGNLYLCINMENDEVSLRTKDSSPAVFEVTDEAQSFINGSHIFDYTTGFLKANGFNEDDLRIYGEDYIGNYVRVRIAQSKLPQNNSKLYQEFPGLCEYQGEGDNWVTLIFRDLSSPIEVLDMLLEDGTEISYQDCKLDSSLTKDHNEHIFGDYEEFLKYY